MCLLGLPCLTFYNPLRRPPFATWRDHIKEFLSNSQLLEHNVKQENFGYLNGRMSVIHHLLDVFFIDTPTLKVCDRGFV